MVLFEAEDDPVIIVHCKATELLKSVISPSKAPKSSREHTSGSGQKICNACKNLLDKIPEQNILLSK